jgi:hypothetical protein
MLAGGRRSLSELPERARKPGVAVAADTSVDVVSRHPERPAIGLAERLDATSLAI